MQTTIVCVTAVKRIALSLLALAVLAANLAARQPAPQIRRGQATHGCQATAPGGNAATVESADVAIAVQHAAAGPGVSTRTSDVTMPAGHASPVRTVFSFARPHDPPHLHAFSLLI
jgi:hypothetical protein